MAKVEFRDTVESRNAFAGLENTNLHKDGRRVVLESSGVPAFDSEGHLVGYRGIDRDITERKRAEEELRESENRYRSLVEANPYGIQKIDACGIITYTNPAYHQMLGYTEEELLGQSILDLLEPASRRDELHQHLSTLVREQPPPATYFQQNRTKDGRVIDVAVDWNYNRDSEGRVVGFTSVITDITERKRAEEERRQLEEQVHQAARLEAIGKLAGGIAHDFNSVLMAISGYAHLLLDEVSEDGPLWSDLTEIIAAVESGADLTRQILAFSRRQPLAPRVFNVNDLVNGAFEMLQRVIGDDIELEFIRAPGLGNVRADRGQIEQVLMNLIVNARDAMPEGGKLTVETANVVLDEAYASTHLETTPGRYVMLAVSDTGCGMDEATQERIFEPFFTTKDEGTGLGLSTAYGIVKQHGGSIWVYSDPGKGATFKVYLPRTEAETEPPRRKPPADRPARGTQTILIVEDQPKVREVTRRALERMGYEVIAAGSPTEAEELFERSGKDVALLLADVVLPKRSGRELYERLVAEHPALKVLYMSGYTDNVIVRDGILEDGTPFLQKPFTPAALAAKVREVLDA
jgi:PAS domain S-box-containing protein